MKKLLLLVIAAAGAFAVWRKMESDKAEQDLWAQATDPV
ncbi:MAG: DLW-39 family protein [Angustibacter sp.]